MDNNSLTVSEIRDQWNDYPEPLDFKKLVDVSRHLLDQVVDVEIVREGGEDVIYLGPELNRKLVFPSLSPSESLKGENIDQEKEEQGRDEINQVLQVILRMGAEHGLRIFKEWRAERNIPNILERAISIIENNDGSKVAIQLLKTAIDLLESADNIDLEEEMETEIKSFEEE